jgi:hypothetical protein
MLRSVKRSLASPRRPGLAMKYPPRIAELTGFSCPSLVNFLADGACLAAGGAARRPRRACRAGTTLWSFDARRPPGRRPPEQGAPPRCMSRPLRALRPRIATRSPRRFAAVRPSEDGRGPCPLACPHRGPCGLPERPGADKRLPPVERDRSPTNRQAERRGRLPRTLRHSGSPPACAALRLTSAPVGRRFAPLGRRRPRAERRPNVRRQGGDGNESDATPGFAHGLCFVVRRGQAGTGPSFCGVGGWR